MLCKQLDSYMGGIRCLALMIKGGATAVGSESVSKTVLKEQYTKFIGKKILFIVVLVIFLILLMGFAATLGSASITMKEVYIAILRRLLPNFAISKPLEAELSDIIVWRLRLPRIMLGVTAGMGLATAGTVMQAILRNPLASPFTLGIASAASFGATLAIILGIGFGFAGGTLVVANAFIFTMLASIIIFTLANYKGATPGMMILIGIALSFTFSASTSLLQFFGDPEEVAGVVFWMFGCLGRASWSNVTVISLVLLICMSYLIWKSKEFNVLNAGDETAKSLGVNVEQLRLVSMLVASFVTAVIICFTGIIGFIGLVCPHICRMLIGGDNRFLLPASCLLGAVVLLGADTVARTIISPVIIPVGIMTSFFGGPLFFYLLMRKREEYW